MVEVAVWMRVHHERNLRLGEPDFSRRFHRKWSSAKLIQRSVADPAGLMPLRRFALCARFVILRQTFVRRSHGGNCLCPGRVNDEQWDFFSPEF